MKSKERSSFDKNNLVVLLFELGPKLKPLSKVKDKRLSVNVEKGVWSYRLLHKVKGDKKYVGIEIGTSRGEIGPHPHYDYRWGVIGVYDKTNIQHLNNMIYAVEESTELLPHNWPMEDD